MNEAEIFVCRTCTNQERRINMKCILTDHLIIHSFKMNMSIIEAFNEVTKLVVDENEPITTLICLNCVRRLRQAVVFRMTAAKSYNLLSKNPHLSEYSMDQSSAMEVKPDVKLETFEGEPYYEEDIIEEDDDVYQEEVATEDQTFNLLPHYEIELTDDTKEDIKPVVKVEMDDKKEVRRGRGRPRAPPSMADDPPKPKPIAKRCSGKETYYCAHCPATFNNKRYTFLHMKKLHMSKKPWRCWINGCGKLYVSPAQRRFHQEAIHYRIKRHVCDICGLCFTDNPKLQSHRRVHTGERPYRCDEPNCDYAFKQPYDLVKHKMSIHSDERPHTCENCGSTFKLKSGLRAHRRLMHSREDLKACPECPKKFLNNAALNNHVTVVHRGERNHICCICTKTYAYRKHLLRHVKDVHPDEYQQMKMTGEIASRGKILPSIYEVHEEVVPDAEDQPRVTERIIERDVRGTNNVVRVIVQQY